jgi:hypothetical protein
MNRFIIHLLNNPLSFEDISKILSNFINFLTFLFTFLKYTLILILFCIGILILSKLRGVYFKQKILDNPMESIFLNRIRLILGTFFIIIALGFLFNYLTYFLIWIFHDFDCFIYIFIRLSALLFLEQFSNSVEPFIDIIRPIISIGSFIALTQYALVIFYVVSNTGVLSNPRKLLSLLIS